MEISKRIASNTTVGLVAKTLEGTVAIVTVPIVLAALGQANYGFYLLIGQTLTMVGALDFGISPSVGLLVAKYKGLRNEKAVQQAIDTSLLLLLLSSLVALVFTGILILNFERIFDVGTQYVRDGSLLVTMFGVGIAVDLGLRIGRGVVAGVHRFDWIYYSIIGGSTVRLVLIVMFYQVFESESLLLLALIAVLTFLLPDLGLTVVARRKIFAFAINRTNLSVRRAKELWSLSAANSFRGMVTVAANSVTILIIGNTLGLDQVPLYSIPVSAVIYPAMFVTTYMISFTNIASELHGASQGDRLTRLGTIGARYALSASTALAVVTFFLGGHFFALWLRNGMSATDITTVAVVVNWLMLGFVFQSGQRPTNAILKGTGRHWLSAEISIAADVLSVILGYLLMTQMELGVVGMAMGRASVLVVVGLFVYPTIALRSFQMTVVEYVGSSMLRGVSSSVPLLVASYLLASILGSPSWITLTAAVAGCLAVYGGSTYFLCLEQEHRAVVVSHLRSVARRCHSLLPHRRGSGRK